MIDLRIYKGFVTLHRWSFFSVKSLVNFQICLPHIFEIANTEITNIRNWTKSWVLNVNLGSEISYDAS